MNQIIRTDGGAKAIAGRTGFFPKLAYKQFTGKRIILKRQVSFHAAQLHMQHFDSIVQQSSAFIKKPVSL